MSYRHKLSKVSTSRSGPSNTDNSTLKLNNGTEIFEVRETFSVNSLIDITFERAKPIRSRHQELFKRLDESIHYENINYQASKLSYIGGTIIPADQSINIQIEEQLSQHKPLPMKQLNINDEYYHEIYFKNMREKLELPLMKYQRLAKELDIFSSDLKQYMNEQTDDNINILLSGVSKMQSDLQYIQESKEYAFILDTNYTRFSNINQSLIKSMLHMAQPEYQQRLASNKLLTVGQKENKNQWNIYQNQKSTKTCGTADAQFLDMEYRISVAENSIGFVSDMKNPFPDVLTAVGFLEGRYEYTFEMIWKTVKKQSEKVAGDLKNIKYHLDLLQARYKPNEKQTRISWEKLEDLYRMMNKWDPMVFQLIFVVQRLQSLQNYHYRSCLFINRVNDIYKQQCVIYESLKDDGQTLDKCLESIRKNKKILKQNCTYIKQRVKRLEARCKT